MTFYRKILSDAWNIAKRNKYLWFFGFFAAIFGSGGFYNLADNTGENSLAKNLFSSEIFRGNFFVNLGKLAEKDPVSFGGVFLVGLLFLALFSFLFWIAVISEAALVRNSSELLKGGNADFHGGIKSGMGKFWPVAGLNLVDKVIAGILGSVFAFISLKAQNFSLIGFLAFLVASLAIIIISFIVKYAIGFVVIKEERFVESIKHGWRLFADNWLVSVEMAIILFFVGFGAGLAMFTLLLVAAVPLFFLTAVFFKLSFTFGFWFILIISLAAYIAVIFLVGAILSVFTVASWTGLFLELVSGGGRARKAKAVKRIKNEI